jgi:putative transposase
VGVLDTSTSPPRERYAVSKDNIIKLIQPGNVYDQLTEILRNGARALLAQAVEAKVSDLLGKHGDLKTTDGHQRVVRHGHLPEREVMTGIGPVAVRQPRVRDREADATDPDRIRFSPSILPPYMRRSKSIETLLPILYLKGISTGDFSEALPHSITARYFSSNPSDSGSLRTPCPPGYAEQLAPGPSWLFPAFACVPV